MDLDVATMELGGPANAIDSGLVLLPAELLGVLGLLCLAHRRRRRLIGLRRTASRLQAGGFDGGLRTDVRPSTPPLRG